MQQSKKEFLEHLLKLRETLDPKRRAVFDRFLPLFLKRAKFELVKGGKGDKGGNRDEN